MTLRLQFYIPAALRPKNLPFRRDSHCKCARSEQLFGLGKK